MSNTKISWGVQVKNISELKGYESNPRTITKEKYDELMSSVDELGNFDPLVINTDGTVIAGNQRLRVLEALGEKEIEVSVPSRKLTPEEVKKVVLLSNKHSGEWDMDMLANEFEDTLKELGFDDLLPELSEGKEQEEGETCPECGGKIKLKS